MPPREIQKLGQSRVAGSERPFGPPLVIGHEYVRKNLPVVVLEVLVNDDLRLQFEAATRLSEEERRALKTVIEGILLAHEARRWTA